MKIEIVASQILQIQPKPIHNAYQLKLDEIDDILNEIDDNDVEDHKESQCIQTNRCRLMNKTDLMVDISSNNLIGTGKSGKVYKGKFVDTDIAYKIYTKYNVDYYNYSKIHFQNEINAAKHLKHNGYTLNAVGYTLKPHHAIISKLCNGSDLYNATKYIYKANDVNNIYNIRDKLNILNILNFLIQIGNGLNFLHCNNMIHRHCHSKNIFIQYKNGKIGDIETPNNMELKIADFNYSKILKQNDKDIINENRCGPTHFLTEEFIRYKLINKGTDIYFFGVLIWQILSGLWPKQPFNNNRTILIIKKLLCNERLIILNWFPLRLKILIQRCWQKQQKYRPQSFKEILSELNDIKNKLEMDKNHDDKLQNVKWEDLPNDGMEFERDLKEITRQYLSDENHIDTAEWKKKLKKKLLHQLTANNHEKCDNHIIEWFIKNYARGEPKELNDKIKSANQVNQYLKQIQMQTNIKLDADCFQ